MIGSASYTDHCGFPSLEKTEESAVGKGRSYHRRAEQVKNSKNSVAKINGIRLTKTSGQHAAGTGDTEMPKSNPHEPDGTGHPPDENTKPQSGKKSKPAERA